MDYKTYPKVRSLPTNEYQTLAGHTLLDALRTHLICSAASSSFSGQCEGPENWLCRAVERDNYLITSRAPRANYMYVHVYLYLYLL
jgi:hypothetical protein